MDNKPMRFVRCALKFDYPEEYPVEQIPPLKE